MAGNPRAAPGGADSLLSIERTGALARVILDNPPANALSLTLLNELECTLRSTRDDDSIRVVVISSSGRVFCAGHDLKELASHGSDQDHGAAFFSKTFETCARLMQTIVAFPKPVIAEVNGTATAAGCQLVASCDLAIASDRSKFGVNGINVGLFCTSPAVALMRVVNRKRAMEMLLTGNMIDAATALEYGLLNAVVPEDQLKSRVDDLAITLAGKSPIALRLGKEAVARQSGMTLGEAYADATCVMVENLMTSDAQSGIEAFIKQRASR